MMNAVGGGRAADPKHPVAAGTTHRSGERARVPVRSALLLAAAALLSSTGALAAAAATTTAPSSTPPAAQAPAVARPAVKAPIVNPSWKELKPAQQQALAPLVSEWDALDATHKSKWLAIARKFETMKPDEQNRVQERMRAWVALTPDQRRVARESYARTKKLNHDQKSAQWQQYQQLPDEQKKKLAAEAAKNKVATLPPAHSKVKTVPPIKAVQKPLLQQSVMPHPPAASQGAAGAPAVAKPATQPTAAGAATAAGPAATAGAPPSAVSVPSTGAAVSAAPGR